MTSISPQLRDMLLGSTAMGGMTNGRRGTSSRLEERALHPTNERIWTLDDRRLSNRVPRLAAAHPLQGSERVTEGSAQNKRETGK